MVDLEGKELEVGAIYIVLGSGSHVVLAKYSHETEFSYVFKAVTINNYKDLTCIYTWKRVLTKYFKLSNCPVIRVSQDLIDKYQIS